MDAERFDQDYYQTRGDRTALWFYARVIRTLHPHDGRLLDFGCGTGHLLRRLESHFDTYGYDISDFARAEARRNAPRARILDDWHVIDPESLAVVTALHILEHLPAPATVLPELVRRLVPGGLFFAVVPNPGGFGHRLKGQDWFAYRDPTHTSLLPQESWISLLRRAGLDVLSVRGDGLWDAPYVRFLPTFLQRIIFGAPAALQVFSPVARPFLPPFMGECLIVEARKRRP